MQNILIHKDNSILQALDKLNSIRNVSRLILFVNDDNNSIIGTLTDGDIRRSLVMYGDLNKKVVEACNKDYIFEFDNQNFINLQSHRDKDIKILPILEKMKLPIDVTIVSSSLLASFKYLDPKTKSNLSVKFNIPSNSEGLNDPSALNTQK